jgi:hypothetical protein
MALATRPKAKLIALRSEFQKLEADLRIVVRLAESDPLSAITPFFTVTSPWHDRRLTDVVKVFSDVNDGQYAEILGALTVLDTHFVRAGRDLCGMNRTHPGEPVTPTKVFLGNIYGLFTLPVPRWKSGKDEPRSSWAGLHHVNAYDVVSLQAKGFIESHAVPMIHHARELIAA